MRITLEQILCPTIELLQAIKNRESFDIEGNIAYVIPCEYQLKQEIDEWCENTLSDDWASIGPAAYSVVEERICAWSFFDEDDAAMFKLTWI